MAPIVHFDYDFSPYGQKTKLILKAAGVDFVKKDEPPMLPRPDLDALGITYRRIPLLAIGKDVYADSSKVTEEILKLGKLPTSPHDRAYQVWGDNFFSEILSLIPQAVLTPEFVKDRATIFPSLGRPDITTLRPSGLAQFISRLREVEEEFLASSPGPFLNGAQISLADIHIIWPIRWTFKNLGVADPGTGPDAFPKLWKLIDAIPDVSPPVIDLDEVKKAILSDAAPPRGPTSVAKGDPLGLAAGTEVAVESFDSTPGSHPQWGKLVGTDVQETVIELANGIRLHFPRIGYLVRNEQDSPAKK